MERVVRVKPRPLHIAYVARDAAHLNKAFNELVTYHNARKVHRYGHNHVIHRVIEGDTSRHILVNDRGNYGLIKGHNFDQIVLVGISIEAFKYLNNYEDLMTSLACSRLPRELKKLRIQSIFL